MSHAASAYPSPFNDAMILTLDGVGEIQQEQLQLEKEII